MRKSSIAGPASLDMSQPDSGHLYATALIDLIPTNTLYGSGSNSWISVSAGSSRW